MLTNWRHLTTAFSRIYVHFFLVNDDLMLSKAVYLLIIFLPLLGDYWTQKMSSATSSPTLCPQRSGTGWLLPSHDKWVWCLKGPRKSPGSEVLSMQYKREYLWKGKGACNYFVLVAAQVLRIAPVVLNKEYFNKFLMMFLHRSDYHLETWCCWSSTFWSILSIHVIQV